MSHETNTFSPVVTDLARFAGGLPGSGAVPRQGQEVLAAERGRRSGLGGFIELVEAAGDQVVASISAVAPPSGAQPPFPHTHPAPPGSSDRLCRPAPRTRTLVILFIRVSLCFARTRALTLPCCSVVVRPGIVRAAAFEHICACILDAVAAETPDGIMLCL